MSPANEGLRAAGPETRALDEEPWARLEAAPDGTSRLRLGGRFLPGWAGALALGLSRLHVTILRGCACRMSRGRWTAFFDVQPLRGAPPLESIDYPALALTGPSEAPDGSACIRLEKYVLGPVVAGALQVGIRGRDCVGFLGGLLDRVATLSLFPEELHVETYADVAEDRFRIRGLNGGPPPEDARHSLDRLLASLLIQERGPAHQSL